VVSVKQQLVPHADRVQFAVFGSWLAFTWAAVETNRDTEDWSTRLIEANPFAMGYSPSSADMRKARYLELGKVRAPIHLTVPAAHCRSLTTRSSKHP
jgi:hypothetical protein